MLHGVALVITDVSELCMRRLLVMANVSSSQILVTLMMEVRSSLQNVGSYKNHMA
jgi:hypothetical protein